MKSFLLLTIVVALFCLYENVYRAELHQSNPAMSGVGKESVLISALQLISTLIYRPVYWNSNQPRINNTIAVCAGPIDCLYKLQLVLNSDNATTSCIFPGGYFDLLNQTDSLSIAFAQEWTSFSSFRAFIVIFDVQIILSLVLLGLVLRAGLRQFLTLFKISIIVLTCFSTTLIILSVIDHNVNPFSSTPNIIIGILIIILYLIESISSFIALMKIEPYRLIQ